MVADIFQLADSVVGKISHCSSGKRRQVPHTARRDARAAEPSVMVETSPCASFILWPRWTTTSRHAIARACTAVRPESVTANFFPTFNGFQQKCVWFILAARAKNAETGVSRSAEIGLHHRNQCGIPAREFFVVRANMSKVRACQGDSRCRRASVHYRGRNSGFPYTVTSR